MKKWIIICVSLLIVVLVAACGSGSTDQVQPGEPSAGESDRTSGGETKSSGESESGQITIEFWDLDGNRASIETIIADFEETYPHINVEFSTHTTDGHKEALKVAAASGTLPHAWFNWGGSLGSFYPANGFTLDLTEYAQEHNWEEKYNPAALELVTLEGQLSGVPTTMNGLGLYYRKDVFENLGLEVPRTFKEFENALKTIKENGITPLSVGGRYGWHTMRFTEQLMEYYAGPELHDQLTNLDASWEHESVLQMFQKLQEWNEAGYFPEGFITLDPTEAKLPLYAGEAAMQLEGQWFDSVLLEDGMNLEDYGWFPFPSSEGTPRVSAFVEMIQINKTASEEEQEAAILFAEHFYEPETLAKHGDILEHPSGRADADQYVADNQIFVPEVLEAMELGGSFGILDQMLPQELITVFFEAQDKVITGEFTPEEAQALMVQSIEDYNE